MGQEFRSDLAGRCYLRVSLKVTQDVGWDLMGTGESASTMVSPDRCWWEVSAKWISSQGCLSECPHHIVAGFCQSK